MSSSHRVSSSEISSSPGISHESSSPSLSSVLPVTAPFPTEFIGCSGSLPSGISTSTFDPESALQAALSIFQEANEEFTFDLTPDEHGVIVSEQRQSGRPMLIVTPPVEGDVDQPCRPYCDSDTEWYFAVPEPWLLAEPPRTFGGDLLEPEQYHLYLLDGWPDQEEQVCYGEGENTHSEGSVYPPRQSMLRAPELETITEVDSSENLADDSLASSSSVATTLSPRISLASGFALLANEPDGVTLPATVSAATIIPSPSNILAMSAINISAPLTLLPTTSDWVVVPSASMLSISSIDAVYAAKRRARRARIPKEEMWTEVFARPRTEPKSAPKMDQENEPMPIKGEGSWVRVSTRPSRAGATYGEWTVIHEDDDFEEAAVEVRAEKTRAMAQMKMKLGVVIGRRLLGKRA